MVDQTRQGFKSVFLAAVLLLIAAGPARGDAPSREIQVAIEKVLTILRDSELKGATKRPELLHRLRQVVYAKFDFAEMAKRSLGSQWQRRSAAEQEEFVKLFTELMENSYLTSLEAYDGEKVQIAGEKQDKEFAEVRTRVVTGKAEEISVNYRLHRMRGNEWKIYDVVIENISLVNNYRSQFSRVIARSSFEELMRRMKEKQFDPVAKQS